MRNHFLKLLIILFIVLSATASRSIYVPPELNPWIKWIKEKNPTIDCIKSTDDSSLICNWSGILQLNADKNGLSFSQKWKLFSDGVVSLPGNTKFWPQNVLVNGKPAPVVTNVSYPGDKLIN